MTTNLPSCHSFGASIRIMFIVGYVSTFPRRLPVLGIISSRQVLVAVMFFLAAQVLIATRSAVHPQTGRLVLTNVATNDSTLFQEVRHLVSISRVPYMLQARGRSQLSMRRRASPLSLLGIRHTSPHPAVAACVHDSLSLCLVSQYAMIPRGMSTYFHPTPYSCSSSTRYIYCKNLQSSFTADPHAVC